MFSTESYFDYENIENEFSHDGGGVFLHKDLSWAWKTQRAWDDEDEGWAVGVS